MKLYQKIALTLFATTFTLLSSQMPVRAHEGHDHGSTVEVPESAEAVMTELQQQHQKLVEAVTAKRLQDVHSITESMSGLAQALPGKVAEDKKPRVQGSVNNLTKLLDTLHHAADDGDQPRAGIELKKLEGVMMALQKQV